MVEAAIPWWNPDIRKQKLRTITGALQPLIDGAKIHRLQGMLFINDFNYTIKSGSTKLPKHSDSDMFVFSGILLTRGKATVDESIGTTTAMIREIQIPDHLREAKIGLGTQLVTAWEEAWTALGVSTFVAESVMETTEAINFWTKMGYHPSASDPSHWYKKISPTNAEETLVYSQ